jgi:hypothetical protein
LSIIPIIPLLFLNESKYILNSTITIWKYDLDLKNNYIRWAVFAVVSFVFAFLLSIIETKFTDMENKKSIKVRHRRFAYLFKAIKELKVYIINDRFEHSEVSASYLRKYFSTNFVNYELKISNEDKTINLPKTLINIQKKNSWLQFTDDSNEIIHAFANTEKLFARINQKTEIEIVVEILNDILCYEYILIHKEKIDKNYEQHGGSLIVRKKFLTTASQRILNLPIIEQSKSDSQKPTSINRVKSFFLKTGEYFINENFVVTFISWFILLTLIFILAIFIGIRAFSIKIDTTLYIGVVSGIILGSITVAATLHSKKKQ